MKEASIASIGSNNTELIEPSLTLYGGVDGSGVFLPDRAVSELRSLAEVVWKQRQRKFLARTLMLNHSYSLASISTGFSACIERFKCADIEFRRSFVEDPIFRIWMLSVDRLGVEMRADSDGALLLPNHLLEEFVRVFERRSSRYLTDVDFSRVELLRYNVDPLLAAAIPPSYDFNIPRRSSSQRLGNHYTMTVFAEVLEAVMRRIGRVWPDFVGLFPRFVKTIIHLPDYEYRSCSAQRFAGAILLSSSDETLLAVEESLIHECGHQILYNVMELEPIIRQDNAAKFTLPWSGSVRDTYGYFHATYIYLILALYLESAIDRFVEETEDVKKRLAEVLRGLEPAVNDFENLDCFSVAGLNFFKTMADISRQVLSRNRKLVSALNWGAST